MNSAGKIRQKFLKFFEKRGHKIVPSSSLLPADPSVLFTTAGMQQFKPYFLGEESPHGDKTTSCQKCLRTSDIESVGDESHLTFFEMLGNFSFGTYFKKETIKMAIDFLVEECKLPIKNIWVTVFGGEAGMPPDEESPKIWQEIGIPPERIYSFGKKDNFWGPTGKEGPCGPTTEIHYDLRGGFCSKKEKCMPGCKCQRFVEVWNLVFNQHYQNEDGSLEALRKIGVDTGMGLERLTMILQNKKSVFESDLFWPIMKVIESNCKKKYETAPRHFRIIGDHLKSSCFLISEGITPSKIERGYVLRRLLRRSMRYGKMIELKEEGWRQILGQIIDLYKKDYPDIFYNQKKIFSIISEEKSRFDKTIQEGIRDFERLIADSNGKITGKELFDLSATHGLPLDLIQDIAFERGIQFDKDGFNRALKKHQEVSRAGAKKKFGGLGVDSLENEQEIKEAKKLHTATHILHAALREILGKEVKQMGSDITPQRLRFDFSFKRKLEKDELEKIESFVNKKIKANLSVSKKAMPLKKALSVGALAFFKERYPQTVNVYLIRDPEGKAGFLSREICAGPHVNGTLEIGGFKILKEEAVGLGIRRIRAVVGKK